jgi:hypothetical protein
MAITGTADSPHQHVAADEVAGVIATCTSLKLQVEKAFRVPVWKQRERIFQLTIVDDGLEKQTHV